MLENDFFNSFIGVYRPYLKATQSIIEKHELHNGQWLVLRDIANHQPTTLVQISKRRFIEKPTGRKFIKILAEKNLIHTSTGEDKREKLLTLSQEGANLFKNINKEVTEVQKRILSHTSLNENELQEVINIMNELHQALEKEEQD